MKRFDCAALGGHADAVAICADCGAAVCPDYVHVTARWLTRTRVINRVVAVERPARTIRCAACKGARDRADRYLDAQASSGREAASHCAPATFQALMRNRRSRRPFRGRTRGRRGRASAATVRIARNRRLGTGRTGALHGDERLLLQG